MPLANSLQSDKPLYLVGIFFMNTNEIWKDVIGYEERYSISNLGKLKAKSYLKKGNNSFFYTKEKILNPSLNKHGYLMFKLMFNKESKTYKIHQLVAMMFLNHLPCKHELYVDHIDRNKLNNNVNNLRIITPKESISNRNIKKTSKFNSISYDKQRNKWVLRKNINGIYKFIGRYNTEEEANKININNF